MSDFKPVYVLDEQLNTTDKMDYGVYKGPAQITNQSFEANSKSASQITFAIQVPSDTTLVSRKMYIETDITLAITGTTDLSAFMFDYGTNASLASFPFHRLVNTAQVQINNNTINLATSDVIDFILNSMDSRLNEKDLTMTPAQVDGPFRNYSDGLQSNCNVLGGILNASHDNAYLPRGAYYIDPSQITGNTIGTGPGQARSVNLRFRVCEPLLISPFIFNRDTAHKQAMYGIQNINMVYNLNASAVNAFRTSKTGVTNVVVSAVNSARILCEFLTNPPSHPLTPSNAVSYYELPRYIQPVNAVIASGSTTVVQSNNVQLNQIPDKLFVAVRPAFSARNARTSDHFLPIKQMNITFNNQNGLLASASPYELFKMSREAGSSQNWNDFNGFVVRGATSGNGNPVAVPTVGSILMLDFGRHISLQSDMLCPGSIGQYTLQFQLTVENNTGAQINSGDYELVYCVLNSGVLINQMGSSSVYTALVSREIALDVVNQEPVNAGDLKRLVGGGIFDTFKSVASKALPIAKALLPLVAGPKGSIASQAIGALGFGKSGAGSSGAGSSGGRVSGGRSLESRLM